MPICSLVFLLTSYSGDRIRPGIYSLSDVARTLTAQGMPTTVNPSCAEDRYVLSSGDMPIDRFLGLLEADSRLTLETSADGTIEISRSKTSLQSEQRIFNGLISLRRTELQSFLSRTASEFRTLASLPPDERAQRTETYAIKSSDPIVQASNQILFVNNISGDWPYHFFSVPLAWLNQNDSLLSRVWIHSTVFESYGLIDPGGYMLNAIKIIREGGPIRNQDEMFAEAMQRPLSATVRFDPLSERMLFLFMNSEFPHAKQPFWEKKGFFPSFVPATRTLRNVFSTSEREAYEQRVIATKQIPVVPVTSTLVGVTVSLSDVLISSLAESSVPVVYYVSPMQDYRSVVQKGDTLQKLFDRLNQPSTEDVMPEGYRTSIFGKENPPDPSQGSVEPIRPFPIQRLTAIQISGAFVLRNERRFYDQACSKQLLTLGAELSHHRTDHQTVPLRELMRVMAEFDNLSTVPGVVPLSVGDYCNPYDLLPFARLALRSPKFQEFLESVPTSEEREIKLRSLEPKTVEKFKDDCLRSCESVIPSYTPVTFAGIDLQNLIQSGHTTGMMVRATRNSKTQLTIELISTSTVLRAIVQNVEL